MQYSYQSTKSYKVLRDIANAITLHCLREDGDHWPESEVISARNRIEGHRDQIVVMLSDLVNE